MTRNGTAITENVDTAAPRGHQLIINEHSVMLLKNILQNHF